MIDISTLTPEQIEGLRFVTQQANAPIVAANATLPADAEPTPLITCKQYIENIVTATLNDYFRQMMIAKTQKGAELAMQSSVDVQVQVAQLLGVPDVINEELSPLE